MRHLSICVVRRWVFVWCVAFKALRFELQIFRGDAPYGYLCGASLSKLCDLSCRFSGATHPTGICRVRRFQSFAI
ncbi:hypothetical protein IQ270_08120 [Microcoleus sp. LEGE 07076]|uniref:hypothetical protein n=1 Tax=Microcoleus sp. LEGE 07076 TaxID=915322 RepID=UPI001883092C|nr:hypothetical protein [Microcoleus sp. LEGE 07076]MBE9184685.1 hypothetical protein [Microcoleus sp. LEGE 07076]